MLKVFENITTIIHHNISVDNFLILQIKSFL